MEELLQVVLKWSACKQQLVLQRIVVQHSEELRERQKTYSTNLGTGAKKSTALNCYVQHCVSSDEGSPTNFGFCKRKRKEKKALLLPWTGCSSVCVPHLQPDMPIQWSPTQPGQWWSIHRMSAEHGTWLVSLSVISRKKRFLVKLQNWEISGNDYKYYSCKCCN